MKSAVLCYIVFVFLPTFIISQGGYDCGCDCCNGGCAPGAPCPPGIFSGGFINPNNPQMPGNPQMPSGMPQQNGMNGMNGMNQGGMNQGGMNQGGMNQGGMNGMNQGGMNGMNQGGMNQGGMNQGGMNGMNQGGGSQNRIPGDLGGFQPNSFPGGFQPSPPFQPQPIPPQMPLPPFQPSIGPGSVPTIPQPSVNPGSIPTISQPSPPLQPLQPMPPIGPLRPQIGNNGMPMIPSGVTTNTNGVTTTGITRYSDSMKEDPDLKDLKHPFEHRMRKKRLESMIREWDDYVGVKRK